MVIRDRRGSWRSWPGRLGLVLLVDAMEREARARGIPLRTFLVAHGGETRPADPVLAGLHAACAARGEAASTAPG